MSPCGLVKNVPQPEDLRRRLQVGKDIDERARVETSGHSGSGEKRRAESGGRRADAVCQLSAGQAAPAAIERRRAPRIEARGGEWKSRRFPDRPRVKSGELKVADAARMVFVSYRQAKRLWRRCRDEGAAGVKHGSAGRTSHRAKPKKVRERALRLVRKKYSG